MPEPQTTVNTALVRVRLVGVETHDALLARAIERAPDPAIFEQHPPVFFSAEASNGNRDAYYSRMMPSSLRNYAADAEEGRAFQDSHKRDTVGRTLGYSLAGKYTGGRADKPHRAVMDFYTVTGLDPQIDQFLGRMRAGLARDVSIGFTEGSNTCSICGGEMYDWWGESDSPCRHFAGVEYPVVGADGKATGERVMAEAHIENARLSEVSTVFDGATPGAGIIGIKARQMADAGLLPPEVRSALAERYELVLPGGKLWTGVARQEERMPKEEGVTPATSTTQDASTRALASTTAQEAATASIRGALVEAGISDNVEIATAIRSLAQDRDEQRATAAQAVADLTAARTECERLRPLADDGTQYRSSLIAECVDAGVRAFGDEYEREQDEAELKTIGIAGIKRRIAAYGKAAGDTFQPGRQTSDEATISENGGPTVLRKREAPAHAYSA